MNGIAGLASGTFELLDRRRKYLSHIQKAIRSDFRASEKRGMARPEGFEPTTLCSGGTRSIHLSYGRAAAAPPGAGPPSVLADNPPNKVSPATPGIIVRCFQPAINSQPSAILNIRTSIRAPGNLPGGFSDPSSLFIA